MNERRSNQIGEAPFHLPELPDADRTLVRFVPKNVEARFGASKFDRILSCFVPIFIVDNNDFKILKKTEPQHSLTLPITRSRLNAGMITETNGFARRASRTTHKLHSSAAADVIEMPMLSTRLAAPRRRRRYGRDMG